MLNNFLTIPPSAGVVDVVPKIGLLSFAPNNPVLVVVVELNNVLGDPNKPPPTAPYNQQTFYLFVINNY